jgi:hypothetical protein
MRKKPAKPVLTLVTPTELNGPPPPSSLGPSGRKFWQDVQSEYDIADVGGRRMLEQVCLAFERAEGLHAEIERDGPMIRTRGAIKEHPAIKLELAARAFIVRTLAKLGLNFEPVRPGPGRPGGEWRPPSS